jgi:hypothetical protein
MSQTGKRRRISEIRKRHKRRAKRREILAAVLRGATDPVTDRKFTGLVMQDVNALREARGGGKK